VGLDLDMFIIVLCTSRYLLSYNKLKQQTEIKSTQNELNRS